MKRVAAALCLSLSLLGCRAEAPVVDHTEGVRGLLAAYERHYNAGDANALARLYAEDAVLLAPGRKAIRGREPIARFWQGGMGTGLSLEGMVVGADGAVGFAAGAYHFPSDSGKFMLGAVREETGEWRIAADIWNADMFDYWVEDTTGSTVGDSDAQAGGSEAD